MSVSEYFSFFSAEAEAFPTVFMLGGVGTMLTEYALDGNALRFALCAAIPFMFCVSLVNFYVTVSPST